MALTYLNPKMIEQPVTFEDLTVTQILRVQGTAQINYAVITQADIDQADIDQATIGTLDSGNITNSGNISTGSISTGSINGNSLVFSTGTFSNLFANEFKTNYFFEVVTADKTFTEEDNSKAFHFDTRSGTLSAYLPSGSLPDGFNISIYNISNESIVIHSDIDIFAPGSDVGPRVRTGVNKPFTGVFIYKGDHVIPASGKAFYGVGVFE